MKKLILAILLFAAFGAKAQQDTSRVEQYCTISTYDSPGAYSKVTVDVNYGETRTRKLFENNKLKDEKGKIKKFNSVTEVLNYMGADGWKLVNSFAVTVRTFTEYSYIFKKEVLKTQVE
jgi:hypothetical protein